MATDNEDRLVEEIDVAVNIYGDCVRDVCQLLFKNIAKNTDYNNWWTLEEDSTISTRDAS